MIYVKASPDATCVSIAILLCILLGLCTTTSRAAGPPPLPSEASYSHLGVASCAGSTCHGAAQPLKGSSVLQNEFLTWEREDPHSKAYKALTGDAGKRIATNLGLKSSTGPECLSCHSDPVPASAQGRRYKASEGVSCEACHGGSEKWLGPHMTGTVSFADNVAVGMYPLNEPKARARLCLSCHQGTDANPFTHKLMGAGHPPVNAFELDTYTATQPAHFRVDADYRKRKTVASAAKTWAVGQVAQATTMLEGVLSSRFAQHGLVPELAFFDCDSCHHAMQPPRWSPGLGGALGPGELRIDDAALTMTSQLAAVLAPPDQSREFDRAVDLLRKSTGESVEAIKAAAKDVKAQLDVMAPALTDGEPTATQVKAIAVRVAKEGSDRGAGSYALAAQTTQAIAALTSDVASPPASLKGGVDALFKATANRNGYNADAFRAALKQVSGSL